MASGEALALIFEMGSLEKFSCNDEDKGGFDGLRSKVVGRARGVSVEAGKTKEDRSSQSHTFGYILDFLEVCFYSITFMISTTSFPFLSPSFINVDCRTPERVSMGDLGEYRWRFFSQHNHMGSKDTGILMYILSSYIFSLAVCIVC